ncbi:hypothetical protein RQM65_01410 [Pricia sp. S334]|uniref:Uncharacterized protein n=1 Tax=Pricia mediterranea TaxID=3076079 RepID=A0ABU3L295_9FLAO|nr:hypothetical protein [Pricia sp. S334]MDT7827319.1 hypothetical protein [Pricia sp. S334]
MKKETKKGSKPFLLKYMALLIGICYLANPMHRQISSVFHEISHVLESPETFLSHPHAADHDHGIHGDNEHRSVTTDHRHHLLDLIDSVFRASDEQHPGDDTALILIKWDNHIGSQRVILLKIVPLATSQNSIVIEQKVKTGYFTPPEEPPQSISA